MLQDDLDMVNMVTMRLVEIDDVIKVNKHIMIQHVPQHIVKQVLEPVGALVKTKGHHQLYKMSSRGVEGSLPLITNPDLNQMVGIMEVELGKDGQLLQQLKCGGDERKGVAVLYGNIIEAPGVNAGPQSLILLLHQKEPHPCRRGGRVDDACNQRVIDVGLHGLSLRGRQGVQASLVSGRAGLQVNSTIMQMMRGQGHGISLAEHFPEVGVFRRDPDTSGTEMGEGECRAISDCLRQTW